jgi:hypothetical protein
VKHKELVMRGEIDKGMDMSAVALAWGEPSDRFEGFQGKRRTERWEYFGSKPVFTNHFFGGYNTGRCGPYRFSRFGAGFGPEIAYVPYHKSTVRFISGKVDEWERVKWARTTVHPRVKSVVTENCSPAHFSYQKMS